MKTETPAVQYITVNGKRAVVLDESEYLRLAALDESWEPPLPAKDAHGNYPAVEAITISIARDIIRERRRHGWTQTELARRARIRPETLKRIEQGTQAPSVRTLEKIDAALGKATGNKRANSSLRPSTARHA